MNILLKYALLFCLCLTFTACDGRTQEQKVQAELDSVHLYLPGNYENLLVCGRHWYTFTLNIDGVQRKFLIYIFPGYADRMTITELQNYAHAEHE